VFRGETLELNGFEIAEAKLLIEGSDGVMNPPRARPSTETAIRAPEKPEGANSKRPSYNKAGA